MKHVDQVTALLRTQIENDEEVSDIETTANEVVEKWIDPLSEKWECEGSVLSNH